MPTANHSIFFMFAYVSLVFRFFSQHETSFAPIDYIHNATGRAYGPRGRHRKKKKEKKRGKNSKTIACYALFSVKSMQTLKSNSE